MLVESFFCKSSLVKQGEKSLVGLYHFNPESSHYDNLNLRQYKNVVLEVHDDHTFEIKGTFPLVINNKGVWNYFDDGDISYVQYKIGNDSTTCNLFNAFELWSIQCGLKSSSSSNIVVFRK